MSIGQREKATQKRVINLFVQELGYTYLGDFTERKNSNIETELLTKFLTGKGYSSVLIRRALKHRRLFFAHDCFLYRILYKLSYADA